MAKISTDKQLIGSVSFLSGETQQFTDAKSILWTVSVKNCRMRRQLDSGSARSRRTQPIRKAVDDIVFDFYGEENPCNEEDYNLAPSEEMQMGGM